jgi:hypothetical protein
VILSNYREVASGDFQGKQSSDFLSHLGYNPQMSNLAFSLIMISAVMHAIWNLLVKRRRHKTVFIWWMFVALLHRVHRRDNRGTALFTALLHLLPDPVRAAAHVNEPGAAEVPLADRRRVP